jgi:hypothetical protein
MVQLLTLAELCNSVPSYCSWKLQGYNPPFVGRWYCMHETVSGRNDCLQFLGWEGQVTPQTESATLPKVDALNLEVLPLGELGLDSGPVQNWALVSNLLQACGS